MRWWQWLLAWFAISIIVGPILGKWIGRLADEQTWPWPIPESREVREEGRLRTRP